MGAMAVLFGVPASLFSEDDEVIIRPVLSEDIGESASVSNHAVEDGADVADHVEPANGKLSISTIIGRDFDLVGSALLGDKEPEEKIYLLKQWMTNGTLLKYSGPVFKGVGILKQGIDVEMKNLVITNGSFKRDTNSGGGFNVTLSLEQIRIAYAEEVVATLPKAARSTTKKGVSETGNTGTAASKRSSTLFQWIFK